jgi:S-DNA-T family DNA segregation ATPase FtsK/SpoIIIE
LGQKSVKASAGDSRTDRKGSSGSNSVKGSGGSAQAAPWKFWENPAFLTGFGTLLIIVSAVWILALVSYTMTWQEDQSLFHDQSWKGLWNDDRKAINWLGRFGAFLGHWTVYRGWGISILWLWFWILLLGLKCLFAEFKVRLVSRGVDALWMASMLSVTLSFIAHVLWPQPFPWGGAFGNFVSDWICGFAGKVGTGLLLTGYWFAWFLIRFDKRLQWPAFRRPSRDQGSEPTDSSFPDSVNSGKSEEDSTLPESITTEDTTRGWIVRQPPGPEHEFSDPQMTGQETEAKVLAGHEPAAQEVGSLEGAHQWTANQGQTQSVSIGVDSSDWVKTGKIGDMEVAVPDEEQVIADAHTVALSESELYDHKVDLSGYCYPTLDLLLEYSQGKVQINATELEANKDQIVTTLRQYGIEIDKIKATVGPTVTLYEVIPAAGVRISRIKNLEDDIALSLAALGIRIIAPMPGKGTVGIEVPNQNKELVGMRGMLASDRFVAADMELPIALGKTISNEIYVADLTKMPHLLMAGATGQGKSVGINSILVSLLYKKHPSELKLVLVDPKKVELSLFRRIEKHFLACLPDSEDAIVTDTRQVVQTVNALGIEMDVRYDLLKDAQVRNLVEYNTKFRKRRLSPAAGHRYLPYIVIVIDEFADLIMTAGKEIEFPITRLAQLARAVGIHLIVATQRPSVNIITGTIKANFPARIAFKVSSKIDSRTILDTGGAEQLVGRGDMLLSLSSNVVRLQCAFVDTPEVEAVCNFIGDQSGYPTAFQLPEVKDPESDKGSAGDGDSGIRDALFDEAARMVVQYQQGSTSLLQRRMTIGYARAGRLIDQLEAAGIVGRFEGSKPREVLYSDLHHLEDRLRQLKGM